MDTTQITALLNTTCLTTASGGFNWPNLIAGGLFGIIGFAAFIYGKKQKSAKPMIIGLVLMIYPYFIPNTVFLYLVGTALTAALYFWRD